MEHNMKLNPQPYAQMKAGKKIIELRLNDEKRQKVKAGDTIIFSNTEIPDLKLYVEVIARHEYPDFGALFAKIPLDVCGFDPDGSKEDAVDEMHTYYSEENERKYGALGIEIQLVDEEDDWTKNCTSETVDIPGFLRRMERIKRGEDSLCPFCGGTVGMIEDKEGRTVMGCNCCDMRITLENN